MGEGLAACRPHAPTSQGATRNRPRRGLREREDGRWTRAVRHPHTLLLLLLPEPPPGAIARSPTRRRRVGISWAAPSFFFFFFFFFWSPRRGRLTPSRGSGSIHGAIRFLACRNHSPPAGAGHQSWPVAQGGPVQ